jgi:hypothetical protein
MFQANSQSFSVNSGTSRIHNYSPVTNSGAPSFRATSSYHPMRPWAMISCLSHMIFQGFTSRGVFTPPDFQCPDAQSREKTHPNQWSDLLRSDATIVPSNSFSRLLFNLCLLSFGPSFHVTAGCDRGPNLQVRRDLMFHEFMRCFMPKPPSHEIVIPQIVCHTSSLIG